MVPCPGVPWGPFGHVILRIPELDFFLFDFENFAIEDWGVTIYCTKTSEIGKIDFLTHRTLRTKLNAPPLAAAAH